MELCTRIRPGEKPPPLLHCFSFSNSDFPFSSVGRPQFTICVQVFYLLSFQLYMYDITFHFLKSSTKALVEACLQRCRGGTGWSIYYRVATAWPTQTAHFETGIDVHFRHKNRFTSVQKCSCQCWRGLLVSERNGVHNWICKSVIWRLAATVVPSEDLNEKNHTSDCLQHWNTTMHCCKINLRPLKSISVRFNLLLLVVSRVKR